MTKCPDCGKRELKDDEKLCPSCLTKRDMIKKIVIKVVTGVAGVLAAIVFILKGGKK